MEQERTAVLSSAEKSVKIQLSFDGERESAHVEIDGIPYHFERIHCSQLLSEYRIDNDPYYHLNP